MGRFTANCLCPLRCGTTDPASSAGLDFAVFTAICISISPRLSSQPPQERAQLAARGSFRRRGPTSKTSPTSRPASRRSNPATKPPPHPSSGTTPGATSPSCSNGSPTSRTTKPPPELPRIRERNYGPERLSGGGRRCGSHLATTSGCTRTRRSRRGSCSSHRCSSRRFRTHQRRQSSFHRETRPDRLRSILVR